MNLNVTYDANTLATAPADFYAATNYVVNLFDSTFTNNANISIEIGYGDFPYDGSQLTSDLGESQQNNIVSASYSEVTQALVNEGAPGASTLPSNSPINGTLELGSAQEKALGLIGSSGTLDGWIGVASNAELQQFGGDSWSFSPTATPGASQYYLVGVIEHELAEVMGRDSFLDTRGQYSVLDLYRYAAPGVRQTGTGDPAYFSIDNGVTNLDSFNDPRIAAGDLGDWAPNAGPGGTFRYAGADAFDNNSLQGQINGLTSTDLTLMAALGWDAAPASPPPPPPPLPPCYCRGTLIRTATGEVPVERLAIGDRVVTLSGACKPVVWIGFGRSLVTRRNSEARPVIVRRGALADDVPARDLYLSHGHALYFEGALIPVEHLINHRSILWDDAARVVEYYHVELKDHDVLFAEGAPAETYHDSGNRAFFHNARPASKAGADKPTFAPVLHDGDLVGEVWAKLFARAGGRIERNTTDDPDLHPRFWRPASGIDILTAIAAAASTAISMWSTSRPTGGDAAGRGRAARSDLVAARVRPARSSAARRSPSKRSSSTTRRHRDRFRLRRAAAGRSRAAAITAEDGASWTGGELELPLRFFTDLLNGPFTLAAIVTPSRIRRHALSDVAPVHRADGTRMTLLGVSQADFNTAFFKP